MATMACSAEEIIELNQTKEYTAVSTFLLDTLFADPNLTAQSSKLWQLLYNKARYNPQFEIKISYKKLAVLLNKSTRTIQRYVLTLVNQGYLIVKVNYKNNGGQAANTILVRFPEYKVKLAKSTKERAKIEPEYISIVKDQPEIIQTTSESSLDSDKNVTRINNIFINNNNNNVVSFSDFSNSDSKPENPNNQPEIQNQESKLDTIQRQLKDMQTDITEITTKYEAAKIDYTAEITNIYGENRIGIMINKNITPEARNTIYHKMKIMHELESQIDYLTNKKTGLESSLASMHNKLGLQNQLLGNPYFIASKPGERRVDQSILLRLSKKLDAYGFKGANKIKLINEVLYESRFGSLVKSNITKAELVIENSINIALKLVREKRWHTPILVY